jgi:peptide/nickel transport system permease protein
VSAQTTAIPEPQLRGALPAYRRWPRALWKFAWMYPFGAVGGFFVGVLLLATVLPAALTPFEGQDPLEQDVLHRLEGPSATHWFGRDALGRDVYARIVYGARTSIALGVGVVLLSKILSVVFGTVSAYYGGWFDKLFQRLIDIGIAVPGLVFIILVVQTLAAHLDPLWPGHGDELGIVISVGLLTAASSSRTIRGVALSLRQEQFVEAALALGASDVRVMFRHIVPNLFAIVIVSASILVGGAVLIESSLSFLGYGVQPPTPSWGRMLNDARNQMVRAPHLAIFPGMVIFMTVYSFNMLGDAMRDKLDPRLRGSN